jgi:hypothetical protein
VAALANSTGRAERIKAPQRSLTFTDKTVALGACAERSGGACAPRGAAHVRPLGGVTCDPARHAACGVAPPLDFRLGHVHRSPAYGTETPLVGGAGCAVVYGVIGEVAVGSVTSGPPKRTILPARTWPISTPEKPP